MEKNNNTTYMDLEQHEREFLFVDELSLYSLVIIDNIIMNKNNLHA